MTQIDKDIDEIKDIAKAIDETCENKMRDCPTVTIIKEMTYTLICAASGYIQKLGALVILVAEIDEAMRSALSALQLVQHRDAMWLDDSDVNDAKNKIRSVLNKMRGVCVKGNPNGNE